MSLVLLHVHVPAGIFALHNQDCENVIKRIKTQHRLDNDERIAVDARITAMKQNKGMVEYDPDTASGTRQV